VLDELERSGAADLGDGDGATLRQRRVGVVGGRRRQARRRGGRVHCAARGAAICYRVVALVELKSHCFEVVAGHRQQRNKCVPGNRLKLADNLLVSVRGGRRVARVCVHNDSVARLCARRTARAHSDDRQAL
jgi:hypothetical protein